MNGATYISVDNLLTSFASQIWTVAREKMLKHVTQAKPSFDETPLLNFAQQPVPQRTLMHLLDIAHLRS
jgi:hypothetical protein